MALQTILLLHTLFALCCCFFEPNGRLSLIRKTKHGKQRRRRRLSLLMDSFVDPVISDDYFYAVLYIGSPLSQRVEMALDTGSGLPYFACSSTCTHCGKHDDKPYIIENSTSFEWISCKHQLCGAGRCKNNVCEWTQRYVDKSSISAVVGSDLVSFYQYPHLPLAYYRITNKLMNHDPLQNEKKLRLTFGCSEHEANTIYRQGADGVMGLSMHHRSFVDQLFQTNAQNNIDLGNKQFAHCFGAETGGLLLFGSVEIQDLMNKFDINPIWTPLITKNGGHGWYRVNTVGFTVRQTQNTRQNMEDIKVHYSSNVASGYHGSVIDTGSSTLSMPRKPSQDIMKAILELVHSHTDDKFEWIPDGTKNYDFFLKWNGKMIFTDTDWAQFSVELTKYFPDIVMLWQGMDPNDKALEFSVPVDRYLLFKKPHICLDLFGDTPSILVGSNVMVNKFMVYDRDNMNLGVADINCDALVAYNNDSKDEKENNKADNNDDDGNNEYIVDNNENIVLKATLKPTEAAPKTQTVPQINEGRDHVVIQMTKVYDVYLKYFGIVLLLSLVTYCVCIQYKKWRKDKGGSTNSSRSNIRYQTVNTSDPDFDESKKIYNHRRKKAVASNLNSSYGNIHMDNMLSMTTPTQSFTSKQHKSQNVNNNNTTITLQHHTNDAI